MQQFPYLGRFHNVQAFQSSGILVPPVARAHQDLKYNIIKLTYYEQQLSALYSKFLNNFWDVNL